MDPSILSAKLAQTTDEVIALSKDIAEKMGLDPSLTDAMNFRHSDPRIVTLRRFEAVRDFMRAIRQALPPPASPEAGSVQPKQKKGKVKDDAA